MNQQRQTPRYPHVVVVTRSFGFPNGMAASNRVRLLSRGLVEQGAGVKVLCLRVSERPDEVINADAAGCVDGVRYWYTPGTTIRSNSFVTRRLMDVRGYLRALQAMRRLRLASRLDCVLLADGGWEKWNVSTHLLLKWLSFLEIPVVREINELPGRHGWLSDSLSDRLSHVRGVDGIVAISGWLADWAEEESRRLHTDVRVITVPIVVDTEEQSATVVTAEPPVFVYSVSAGYVRDLAFVLRAMQRVWERHPQAKLLVTGMDPRQVAGVAKDERLDAEFGDGRIVACGYLDRPLLLSAYRAASALLIPLSDDLKSRARFPSKVGEYLASGRPVITCNVGEIDRFLHDRETAYVSSPGNVMAFARSMLAVLDDPSGAAAVGEAGRQLAGETFAYGPHAARLKMFMEKLCAARHVRDSGSPPPAWRFVVRLPAGFARRRGTVP
jgi:glycosyltransferase involved in cell wall biosynthesis